jgi:hypothetical protein
VSHAAIKVDGLSLLEPQGGIAIGMEFEFAVDNVKELLAVVPHELPKFFQ